MIRSITLCSSRPRHTRATENTEGPEGLNMTKLGHSGNGHERITETPDVSHIKNVDVTHELSDVNVPAILKFVAGLTVMTIGSTF